MLNTVFENCGVMNSLGSRVHSLPEDWTLLKKHTSLKLCDMQFYSICQKPWEPENLTILTLKDGRGNQYPRNGDIENVFHAQNCFVLSCCYKRLKLSVYLLTFVFV